jgi:hypothetical protein
MYFVFGHRLYGKVDAIPGIGHVATKFFHFDYVPLVPTESWLVTAQSGKTWRGVKIPLSAKSVFVGWGRATAILAAVTGAVIALVSALDRRPDPTTIAAGVAIVAASIGFVVLTKKLSWFNRASYARACQLAKLAKLNDHGLAALAKAYGEAVPALGFQPVMPAARPVAALGAGNPDLPVEVEMIEDEEPSPAPAPPVAPPKAAAPLRGY